MEKSQNNLLKSKSSNGTTTMKHKPKRNDKKSRSHAEIKTDSLKKRGVYVENKTTKTLLSEAPDSVAVKVKCVSRKKRCLTSALDIQSQNTNTMQCKYTNDINYISNNANSSNSQRQDLNEYIDDFLCAKKKTKSRKQLASFRNEIDDFVVHKSNKDFTFTPSNYSISSPSNPEDIKWSEFLPRLVPKTDSEIDTEKMIKKTIHSKINTIEKSNKDDDNVYNLFVDLFETTFNVYNVKTELDTPVSTHTRSSRHSIEIDMAVPKRISTANSRQSINASQKMNYYNMHDDMLDDVNRFRPASPIIIDTRKRKLKSRSFFSKKRSSELATRSFIHQKSTGSSKKSLKDDGKDNLLKMLKKQLKIENAKHMAPQSFFQALKVMAKNKRQNTIQFDETADLGRKNNDDLQRMFKKECLLTSTAKKINTATKKPSLPPLKKTRSLRSNPIYPTVPITRRILSNIVECNIESRHSLQVFAVEEEKHRKQKLSVSPVASFEVLSTISSNEGTLYLSDDSSLFEAF